jgi:hypothetical protein
MVVKLPPNIDYTLYHGDSGLSTKDWGPPAWSFLFACIIGRYPVKIDLKNKEHRHIQRTFRKMLTSLNIVLPCVFCRDSFKQFCKELPIRDYLVGRIELMYWLYSMKDKVNKKLEKQEQKCYNNEKKRLKMKYYKSQISREDYYKHLQKFRDTTFKTVPTPPFKEVLDQYEALRAVCSAKSLSCVLAKE